MSGPLRATDLDVLEHFFAQERGVVHNPADVVRARRWVKLSRPGAAASMERLSSKGHLKRTLRRARNQKEPTPHYQLVEDSDVLPSTLAAYLDLAARGGREGIDRGLHWLLGSALADRCITPDFVMRRLAGRVEGTWFYLPDAPDQPPEPMEAVGDVPDGFPDELRNDLEKSHPYGYAWVDFAPSLDETALRLMGARIKSFCGGARHPTKEEARGMVLARLIMPFLAPIRASTTALREFLEDWDAVECNTVKTLGPVEHVVFRLIFATLDQTARTRRAPIEYGSGITRIEVGPSRPCLPGGTSPLLLLQWSGGPEIAFRANFDTDELVYGEELVVVENGPEDCFVDVWYAPYVPMAALANEDYRSDLAKMVHQDPEWESERFHRLL